MPSKSKKQYRFMQLLKSIKQGKVDKNNYSKKIQDIVDNISTQKINKFLGVKYNNLKEDYMVEDINKISPNGCKTIECIKQGIQLLKSHNYPNMIIDTTIYAYQLSCNKLNIKFNCEQYYKSLKEDLIPNGKGDNTNLNDIDLKQLIIGLFVESEHTNDINRTFEIAVDHLTETPNYYTILIKSKLVDEKNALNIYNKFYK